jgi:DNA-binding PadR family transcriptional regulator
MNVSPWYASALLVLFSALIWLDMTVGHRRRKRHILAILASDGPMTGLELRERGASGTVYVALADLEKEGFVASRDLTDPRADAMGLIPRRVYSLTEAGRERANGRSNAGRASS